MRTLLDVNLERLRALSMEILEINRSGIKPYLWAMIAE